MPAADESNSGLVDYVIHVIKRRIALGKEMGRHGRFVAVLSSSLTSLLPDSISWYWRKNSMELETTLEQQARQENVGL
jgi:hypothetical protein